MTSRERPDAGRWWPAIRSGHSERVRLGLLSDVHGNRLALEAVVSDGGRNGVEGWWVLGDLVAIGPDPVESLEILANLPNVRFVRGNTDRYVVSGDRPTPHASDVDRDPALLPLFLAVESSFAWTRDQMGQQALAWLAALPVTQRLVLADGTRLVGVHASPRSDDGTGITPDLPDRELETLLADADADVVCGGHTHQPTDRHLGPTRAINLGSVSNPITADLRATYVLIESDRYGHRIAHRHVSYDHDAVLERVRRSGHPQSDYIASFQRGEQVRYPATRAGAPEFGN
jgi:predicted phosphodiesterase